MEETLLDKAIAEAVQTVRDRYEDAQETLQVACLGARDLFGEQGVLLDIPHTASVIAQSELRLLSLHKVDLLSVGDAAAVERLAQATTRLTLIQPYPRP